MKNILELNARRLKAALILLMKWPKRLQIRGIVLKSKKLRESARGEDCMFNIVDVCNYNPETTVLCHLPDESKGMGKKSDDISAAYGCSDCHDVIDVRRVHYGWNAEEREWYMRRAMVRTWRKLIEKGIVVIK